MATDRRKLVLGIAILVALQAGAVAVYLAVEGGRGDTAAPFPTEPARGPAPALLLERADGTRVALADLGGRVRLIHFWATWCPPCVDELPGLLRTARSLADDGLILLAISADDDWDAVRQFFDGDVPPEVFRAVEDGATAAERYDVATLPDTYLVDRKGQLRVRYGGARDWPSAAARAHLRAWLER